MMDRSKDIALASRHQVHLWHWPLEGVDHAQIERAWRLLSFDERRRAERFLRHEDRVAFAFSHAGLRLILGTWVGCDPATLRLTMEAHGKPCLALDIPGVTLRPRPFFNLSHSHGMAALAISTSFDLGVDIELIRPIEAEDLARRFFSAAENAALASLAEEDRLEAFFTAWTRKEAYLKAIGLGLAAPLDAFDVSLVPGDSPRLLAIHGNTAAAARWQFAHFIPRAGFIGAVAARAQGWTLVQEAFRFP